MNDLTPEELQAYPPDDMFAFARGVARSIVPAHLPKTEEVECTALHIPCNSVGGDLYDVVRLSDTLLAFFIFDVAGHGVQAALIASMAKVSVLRHLQATVPPRAVMERVNADIKLAFDGRCHLTAVIGYLDLHNNRLAYCNAGHAYPLVFKKENGALEMLKSSGLLVGMFDDGHFEEKQLFLAPGDWLTIFSNGIFELFSSESELDGRASFERFLRENVPLQNPSHLLDSLKTRYLAPTQDTQLRDDLTMLIIEVLVQSRKDRIKTDLGFAVGDPVYVQFMSYFEEMDRAAAVILREMDEFGYADDSIRKMKIALTELFANAIYHGNNKDYTKKVTIGHLITKEVARVSIMDEGEGFDLAQVPDPTLPENLEKDCGRGIFIVNSYVDKIEYNAQGNRATIWKRHQ